MLSLILSTNLKPNTKHWLLTALKPVHSFHHQFCEPTSSLCNQPVFLTPGLPLSNPFGKFTVNVDFLKRKSAYVIPFLKFFNASFY